MNFSRFKNVLSIFFLPNLLLFFMKFLNTLLLKKNELHYLQNYIYHFVLNQMDSTFYFFKDLFLRVGLPHTTIHLYWTRGIMLQFQISLIKLGESWLTVSAWFLIQVDLNRSFISSTHINLVNFNSTNSNIFKMDNIISTMNIFELF